MIISRLRLKNWRNFREVDVPLQERQFIVGPNAFQPQPLLKGGHLQTIVGHISGNWQAGRLGVAEALPEKLWIKTQDGSDDQLLLYLYRPPYRLKRRELPAALLVHGLEGSSSSSYIVNLSRHLLERGFPVAQLNLRGCGEGIERASNCYNAGLTIDLESAVDYLSRKVSDKIVMIGFSLGANLIIKFLGEDEEERQRQLSLLERGRTHPKKRAPADRSMDRSATTSAGRSAATTADRPGDRSTKTATGRSAASSVDQFIAISPPLDLSSCCKRLDSPACRIYRRYFLKSQKARTATGRYNTGNVGWDEIEKIKTFFDFDNLVIAPTAGFKDAEHYYYHCSSGRYIDKIAANNGAIKGYLLYARDDPLIPPGEWDRLKKRQMVKQLGNIFLQETVSGGHVGWLAKKERQFPNRRWLNGFILHLLEQRCKNL